MSNSQSHILIIDDIPKNLQILGSRLQEEGYKVEFATDGQSALNWIKKESFDLILLDIMMPGMSGFEVCKILREDRKNDNIPIIFLTAKDDQESVIQGFDIGAQDYIVKPFEKRELIARVKTHLELKSKREALSETNKWLEDKVTEKTQELQKANMELQALDQAKTDFLKMISHEIRTPLNGIMGVSELLKMQINSPEYFKLFSLLDISVKRLEKFAMDALQITSLKTGKYALKLEPFALDKVINQVLLLQSESLRTKNIEIRKGDIEQIDIIADRKLIVDCFKRIIGNSIKHTPDNGFIRIDSKPSESNIGIEFTDSGPGFKESFLNKKITTFSTEKDFYNQNMGFDIAIIEQIVVAHSGNLELANHQNGGALVTISLPKNQNLTT